MDGWIDRSIDRWMDGWMDRWTDGWMDQTETLRPLLLLRFLLLRFLKKKSPSPAAILYYSTVSYLYIHCEWSRSYRPSRLSPFDLPAIPRFTYRARPPPFLSSRGPAEPPVSCPPWPRSRLEISPRPILRERCVFIRVGWS